MNCDHCGVEVPTRQLACLRCGTPVPGSVLSSDLGDDDATLFDATAMGTSGEEATLLSGGDDDATFLGSGGSAGPTGTGDDDATLLGGAEDDATLLASGVDDAETMLGPSGRPGNGRLRQWGTQWRSG